MINPVQTVPSHPGRPPAWLLPLALLLVTRLALGLSYSLAVPVWEADNEDGHFAYARYLARYHHLLQPGDPEAEQIRERFQPPLYYLLMAPILARFNLGETFALPRLNLYLAHGDAGVNYALHPAQLQGADLEIARAVHTARVVGVVISTLSVLFVYQAAGRLWPRQRAAVWAAACLYAFWPQFVFSGSVMNNDLLVTALSAGIFDAGVLLLADGFRPRRALALAALLTAAMLTKINAIALLPAALLALALSLTPAVRRAGWRSVRAPRLWLLVLALLALTAVTLSVLSSLNFVTGQVLRLETFTLFVNNLPGAARGAGPGSTSVAAALAYGFRTYFASFGWGNLETLPWVYPLWGLAAALAAAGLLLRLARGGRGARGAAGGPPGRLLLLLALQLFCVVAASLALVIATGSVFVIPGRYLLPTLPAAACLLVEGWRSLASWRRAARLRAAVLRAGSLGVVLAAWLVPVYTLAPAYAQPLPLQRLPGVRLDQNFGDAIMLIGYDVPARVTPGQTASVTLCWKARQPVAANYSVFLEVDGPDGQGYGRLVTYPGRGNYPTSFWKPGVSFCDEYRVPVGENFPAPALAWVRVALLVTTDINGARLSPTGADGSLTQASSVDVPLVVALASRPGPLAHTASYRVSNALALRGYTVTLLPAQHAVQVDLRWEALRDQDTNYAVFVHLHDAPDHAYAQGDGEPRGGWYPTALWRKGEIVIDTHLLPLPPGPTPPLALVVGVVLRDTQDRLPVYDAAAAELPDDEAVLEQNLAFPAQTGFALAIGAFQP